MAMPSVPPRLWRVPSVVTASSLTVMGSVVKTAAMVRPMALTRSKASPILPTIVRTCELIATNKLT